MKKTNQSCFTSLTSPTAGGSRLRPPFCRPGAGAGLGLALAVGFTLLGCGKKVESPTVTEAELVPIQADAPTNVQEEARIARAVAFRQGIAPPPPAIQLRGGELATPEVIAAYNQAILGHIFREKDAPETLQELARTRGLPRLPTPPPGKRIVYDPVNHIIRLDPP